MSLTLLNKKFLALQVREKQIEQHYDPVNRYRKQHPHIEDLRQDYQEDLENYGNQLGDVRRVFSPNSQKRTRDGEPRAFSLGAAGNASPANDCSCAEQ